MRRRWLLVALLLVGCGSSEVGDTGLIRWTASAECADGLLVTDDSVIVVSPEVVSRFDVATGDERWAATMSDTSGSMAVQVVDDADEVRLQRRVEGQDCYSPVATGEGVAATTTVLGELLLVGPRSAPDDGPPST